MNQQLQTLYATYTEMLLAEWRAAFQYEEAPCRINEFGIIDTANYAGILCVCRETNGWNNEDYREGVLFRSWMDNIVNNGLHGCGHISKHPNMWYNLARWSALIQNPHRDLHELTGQKDLSPLKAIAFTNINKVRGKNNSGKEYEQLSHSPVTRQVLREEISILQPTIILCGGTAEVVKSALSPDFAGLVLDMPHPACRKGTHKLLCELKKQLVNMENL